MTTRPRRLQPVLMLALAAAVSACGGTGASPATAVPSDRPTAAPTTAVSSAPSSAAPSAASSQSDTPWGRIWDGVPAGFPRFAGANSADDATPAPVSDAYVVEGGDAATIAEWLQSSMEGATYSTESLSGPLEDGGFVLDSVGGDGCRIQTTIAPQGGLILVTVLYGADCPAS